MKRTVRIVLIILISTFVVFSSWQVYLSTKLVNSSITCGGDWSYSTNCPIGSFCKNLGQGSLAGGICTPYLNFSLFLPPSSKVVPQTTPVLQPTEETTSAEIDWSIYSDEKTWVYFNKNYQETPERKFRFKYPPAFKIANNDSGAVWLMRNSIGFMALEDYFSFANFSKGSTLDEKFVNFYLYLNKLSENEYKKVKFEKSFIGNKSIYKVNLNSPGYCGGGFYESEDWYCVMIDDKGKGLSIAQLKPIPADIFENIIGSVELQ